jgi:hypothetical protein
VACDVFNVCDACNAIFLRLRCNRMHDAHQVIVAATLDSGIIGPFVVKINCNVHCVAMVLGSSS